MISSKMHEAFNAQINAELYSAYLYMSMASYCEVKNFKGFAHWLNVQGEEERVHAGKLITHLHDRGVSIRLRAIEAPPHDFESMESLFSSALGHEEEIARKINELYAMAVDERDYPAQVLLQWFITEQVEEIATASEMVENIRRVGENRQGMFLLDRDAANRGTIGPGDED